MTGLLVFLFVGLTHSGEGAPHIKEALKAYQQGKAALLRKEPAAGIELLNKAIEIEPTFLEAYKALIDARMASGDRLAAAATITRLLEIDPLDTHYRLSLAQILFAERQTERSLAQFTFILREDPLNADALAGFAAAARLLGFTDRAAEALAKGRKQYPLDRRFRVQ